MSALGMFAGAIDVICVVAGLGSLAAEGWTRIRWSRRRVRRGRRL